MRWVSSCVCRDGEKARGRARTDSPHVLAKVRALHRVELVGETLRAALHVLALVAPDWLCAQAQPEWIDRYDRPAADDRSPRKKAEREVLVERIGADGAAVLAAVGKPTAPGWLREGPAVEVLRQVGVQNSVPTELGPRWRSAPRMAGRHRPHASARPPAPRPSRRASAARRGSALTSISARPAMMRAPISSPPSQHHPLPPRTARSRRWCTRRCSTTT
jgi:hypothetical protein